MLLHCSLFWSNNRTMHLHCSLLLIVQQLDRTMVQLQLIRNQCFQRSMPFFEVSKTMYLLFCARSLILHHPNFTLAWLKLTWNWVIITFGLMNLLSIHGLHVSVKFFIIQMFHSHNLNSAGPPYYVRRVKDQLRIWFVNACRCRQCQVKIEDILSQQLCSAFTTVTTSTDSGFTAMTGASQYLIMPKHMSKELAEPMNINWKTSSIHRFENG